MTEEERRLLLEIEDARNKNGVSIKEIADEFNIPAETFRYTIVSAGISGDDGRKMKNLDEHILKRILNYVKSGNWKKGQQPCWNCSKANGGCSWSDKFVPVKGLVADHIVKEKYGDSYDIHYCPQYDIETEVHYYGGEEPRMRLIEAIVGTIRSDAIEAYEEYYEYTKRMNDALSSGDSIRAKAEWKWLNQAKGKCFSIDKTIEDWFPDHYESIIRRIDKECFDRVIERNEVK